MTEEEILALQEENNGLKNSVADLTKSSDSMRAKMDELLTETKIAKSAKKDLELLAEQERNNKAKDKGDFEGLFNTTNEKLSNTEKQLEALNIKIAGEKTKNAAMMLASTLADGSNVELLSDFISRRIKYVDDDVKVTSVNGELTVSSLEDLGKEFKNDARFASLLKGNQSSGGGAAGGSNSSGAAKTNLTSTQRIAAGLKEL